MNVHAALDCALLRRAAPVLADEADRVRVVHHHHRVILIRQVADPVEFGKIAVHREDAVGRDQTMPRRCGLLQFRLQIVHVAVAIAKALRLAEPDAVDDAGMIQLVGDDGVLRIQQRFEEPAVGVEAGAVEDGVFRAEKRAEPFFKLLVKGLRAANKAYAGQTVAPLPQGLPGCLNHRGMIGQAQIIVRAEVQNRRATGDGNECLLRPVDHSLPLVEARAFYPGDLLPQESLHLAVHNSPFPRSRRLSLSTDSSNPAPPCLPRRRSWPRSPARNRCKRSDA